MERWITGGKADKRTGWMFDALSGKPGTDRTVRLIDFQAVSSDRREKTPYPSSDSVYVDLSTAGAACTAGTFSVRHESFVALKSPRVRPHLARGLLLLSIK